MTKTNPFYFGIESELAVLGEMAARERFAHELPSNCQQSFPALKASISRADLFLPWGRLYIDIGSHPEWATAETTDPWMAVYFQKVGESILSYIVKEYDHNVSVSRHNVDYLSNTTWGSHESYLIKSMTRERLSSVLIPHLVTRIIYTGAGGLKVDFERQSCQFMISPRIDFLTSLADHGSQSNRPLFHLKNESLCKIFRRLHLICGENLFSETAAFLKIATTALLVLLADYRRDVPVCETLLDDPLKCAKEISQDILLNRTQKTKTCKFYRPLDIQWRYLEYVYSKIDEPFMPPWTRFTCELWQKTLMRLEKGWYSVSSKLDWAVKLRLYEKKLQQWGYSFFKRDKPIKLSEERLFELLQYDLCCSRLGESGLFEQLDKKGCFDHHVTGVPKITNPTTFQKPVMGRAAIRAKIIEKLCKQKENRRFRAGWNYIMSSDGGKRLKLDDVDTNNTEWHTHKSKIPIQLINALKYLER